MAGRSIGITGPPAQALPPGARSARPRPPPCTGGAGRAAQEQEPPRPLSNGILSRIRSDPMVYCAGVYTSAPTPVRGPPAAQVVPPRADAGCR